MNQRAGDVGFKGSIVKLPGSSISSSVFHPRSFEVPSMRQLRCEDCAWKWDVTSFRHDFMQVAAVVKLDAIKAS